jgi:hypothetical protein
MLGRVNSPTLGEWEIAKGDCPEYESRKLCEMSECRGNLLTLLGSEDNPGRPVNSGLSFTGREGLFNSDSP